MIRFAFLAALAWSGAFLPTASAQAPTPIEPFFAKLSPGIVVVSSGVVPAAQTEAIGQKLGGKIDRLTNSVISIHGRRLQVNGITTRDAPSAQAIHAALRKIRPEPYCLLRDRLVIEYVAKDLDPAIAQKASFELGFDPKPKLVRYRIVAEMATVDQADYMACNALFNAFLQHGTNGGQSPAAGIAPLAAKFRFGNSLTLRATNLGGEAAERQFQPPPRQSRETSATVTYDFDQLPRREQVPYVVATMSVSVDDTGLRPVPATPDASLTAATSHWPATDPEIVALARQITAGKESNGAKAKAILEWLTPGKNLQYSGEVGSRWGSKQVLTQKFGRCWDFSDCFITLCRAANIPSRQVAGWLYGSEGHVWAEFYREGKGWQQVDPTGGGQLLCGIYHVPYLTSEDGEMPVVYLSKPQLEIVR